MEQREQKSGLVLKYGKRRFDGGNEIELIRSIEKQKALKQLHELQKQHLNEVQMELAARQSGQEAETVPKEETPPQAVSATPPDVKRRVWEALLLGPLAICIGSVGIMTAMLAIAAFTQMKNEAMLLQSRQVLKDCWKTLRKGLTDLLSTPVRVYKAATGKS
jgi:hypothetical protein